MQICKKCILTEAFPGIHYNKEGICNFCLEFKGLADLEEKKKAYKQKFERLLKEHKGGNNYDVLMCYSGGKDSSYTLAVLKEDYGLNILAVTFDNGFIPGQTFENIRNVVESLAIDHIFFKPRFEILKKIFCGCVNNNIYPRKTLERASTICTSCMGLVKFNSLRLAIEKNIPFIAFGWSPGQAPITSSIMKNNPEMIKMMQNVIYEPLSKLVGDEINQYFLETKHFDNFNQFSYNINPMAFLEYNEEKIYRKISQFGWKAPQETDANSTNCLLNSFANVVHKKQFNFHPYAFEMAKLIREGYIDRKKALEKIMKEEDFKTIGLVKKKLGL